MSKLSPEIHPHRHRRSSGPRNGSTDRFDGTNQRHHDGGDQAIRHDRALTSHRPHRSPMNSPTRLKSKIAAAAPGSNVVIKMVDHPRPPAACRPDRSASQERDRCRQRQRWRGQKHGRRFDRADAPPFRCQGRFDGCRRLRPQHSAPARSVGTAGDQRGKADRTDRCSAATCR